MYSSLIINSHIWDSLYLENRIQFLRFLKEYLVKFKAILGTNWTFCLCFCKHLCLIQMGLVFVCVFQYNPSNKLTWIDARSQVWWFFIDFCINFKYILYIYNGYLYEKSYFDWFKWDFRDGFWKFFLFALKVIFLFEINYFFVTAKIFILYFLS